ncbi:DUF302 domain-containing protein [Stappia sp. F7233]|uniref:DUF302 domain-containing protein n=1 Tax=Stappia albiluteola TaxID=2758565 RepID=A0A839A9A0_9HYPH|nr:DUF302 domain-containing protein [Stappia albiluteola]MBA5775527.1 DUF302 domain-containing protein [Stappia albiluteola]
MSELDLPREAKVGAMLPCNVALRESASDIEVSAIDNAELLVVAGKPRNMLAEIVAAI